MRKRKKKEKRMVCNVRSLYKVSNFKPDIESKVKNDSYDEIKMMGERAYVLFVSSI